MPNATALLWFVAVIAAIPALLWLLKRTPLAGGGGSQTGAPRAVAVLPLAAQQRLVTVEVGQGEDRLWLVLGVSPQGISKLHTMSAQVPAADPPPAPPAATFNQLLRRLRGGGDAAAPDAR
jgi:flagellar protein FliO/FliZ